MRVAGLPASRASYGEVMVGNHIHGHFAVGQSRGGIRMGTSDSEGVVDGAQCKVIAGTHAGKSGTVRDINTSKTGHVTITVVQNDGERFKTLARNVAILTA